jgi:ribose 5-phosphate isomerase B
MKLAIGADHAGYAVKELVKSNTLANNHEITDFGTGSPDSVDYADFAHPLSTAVEKNEFELGILVCGSANGVAMTANKHAGIRAAICWTEELAALARQHNDANVLCLPARFISSELAQKIVNTFLSTEFEGGRHATRVNKISC